MVALNALDGPDIYGTLKVAKKLLDYQYKKWENKNADDVFAILKPSFPESNIFSSPAFSAWAGFVKSTSLDQQATATMLSVLEHVYKDDLSIFFAEGQIEKMKPDVKELHNAIKRKLLKRKSSQLAERPLPKRKRPDSNKRPLPDGESTDLAERPLPKQPRNFDLNKLPSPDGESPDLAERL